MKKNSTGSATIKLVVPFHDVDSMNVVWHGHYFKYFEIARTAYFRRIGFDIAEMAQSGFVFPVIESHCRYVAPLLYGMTVEVTATLTDMDHRLKFLYSIIDSKTRRRMTTGHTVQASVKRRTGELCLMTPSILLQRLRRVKHGRS